MASRRQSVFRASVAPGGGSRPQDPRDIKSKAFQARSIEKILDYLAAEAYPTSLSPKTLQSPTKKDFEGIFKFLYARIDPTYQYLRKFEEEVMFIMKTNLKYPFADSISKSAMYAVGSVQTWPALLAMLVWLVELVSIADKLDTAYFEMEPNAQWATLCKVHDLRAKGFSDDDIKAEFEADYAKKIASLDAEIQDLEKCCAELQNEIDTREKTESPLVPVMAEHARLQGELRHLQETHQRLLHDRDTVNNAIADLQAEAARLERDAADLLELHKELDRRLECQEISRQEAERMANEKEVLTRDITQTEKFIADEAQLMYEREIALQQMLHEASRVYSDFRELAKDLELIPSRSLALAQELGGVDFELELNRHSDDPKVYSAAVQRATIIPAMSALRQQLADQLRERRETADDIRDQLANMAEAVAEMEAAIAVREAELTRLTDEYRARRQGHENALEQLHAEYHALHGKIAQAQATAATDVMVWQNKAHRARIECEATIRRCNERREQLSHDLVRVLEFLVNAKAQIEDKCKAFERSVVEYSLLAEEPLLEGTGIERIDDILQQQSPQLLTAESASSTSSEPSR